MYIPRIHLLIRKYISHLSTYYPAFYRNNNNNNNNFCIKRNICDISGTIVQYI